MRILAVRLSAILSAFVLVISLLAAAGSVKAPETPGALSPADQTKSLGLFLQVSQSEARIARLSAQFEKELALQKALSEQYTEWLAKMKSDYGAADECSLRPGPAGVSWSCPDKGGGGSSASTNQ